MADIGAKISIDGEKQFRQEMNNIVQQGKTLSAEMDNLSTAFKNADDSEKDYTKVTEKLNEQIDNQKKLVDKLKEAVEKSTQKTGENSTETLKWKEKLAKAEKGLNDLEAKAKDAASGVDTLGKEEEETSKSTSIFGDVLKANLASEAIKKGVSMLADVVKDVAKFFVDAVKGAAEYADEINTLSKTTGMSTDALQEYKYMADLVDVDLNTITGSVTKLKKSMLSAQDGTGATAEAFSKLGVATTNADGSLRDANDVFDDIVTALGQMDNETERDAIAMQVLGKSANELNPLIEAGADNLKGFRKEAHKVGAVLDQETLDTLNEVQDGFDRLGGAWDSLKRQLGAKIGAKILPDLEKIVGLFQNLVSTKDVDGFIDGVTDMVDDLIKKIPDYTEKIIKEIPKVLKTLAKAIGKLLPELGNSIGKTLGQIFKNLPELISAGLELGWSLIKGVLTAIPNMVSGIVDALTGKEVSEATKEARNKLAEIKEELENIPKAAERAKSALSEINGQQKSAEHWFEIFKNIRSMTDPTAEDLELMRVAAAKLNEIFPELGLKIDEETGKWNLSNTEIEKNIKLLEARARASAYFNAADDTLQEIARLEMERDKLAEDLAPIAEQHSYYKGYVQHLADIRRAMEETYDAFNRGAINADEYFARLSEITGKEVKTYEQATEQFQTVAADLENATAIYNEINDQFQPKQEAIDAIEESIAELNKDVDWLFSKGTEWEAKATATGEALAAGVARGIKNGKKPVTEAASGLMKSAIDQMKNVAQIHSPSKVTENLIGKNLALGVIKGWEDVFSMRNPLSLRGAINGAASTTNNMNLGGVSVNVYAQEGQDANAIAQLVMRKMQGAVDSRKAVFA